MLLAEHTWGTPTRLRPSIFATDIDSDALVSAREGFYTLTDAADVSPERLARFFVEESGGYRVRKELRALVLFACHNVIRDPPFSHLDLVSCRNLLIYLNTTVQRRLMDVLNYALDPGGYLFLGSSESIGAAGDLFVAADKDARLFESRRVSRVVVPLPLEISRPPARLLRGDNSRRPEIPRMERLSVRRSAPGAPGAVRSAVTDRGRGARDPAFVAARRQIPAIRRRRAIAQPVAVDPS